MLSSHQQRSVTQGNTFKIIINIFNKLHISSGGLECLVMHWRRIGTDGGDWFQGLRVSLLYIMEIIFVAQERRVQYEPNNR